MRISEYTVQTGEHVPSKTKLSANVTSPLRKNKANTTLIEMNNTKRTVSGLERFGNLSSKCLYENIKIILNRLRRLVRSCSFDYHFICVKFNRIPFIVRISMNLVWDQDEKERGKDEWSSQSGSSDWTESSSLWKEQTASEIIQVSSQ